MLAKTGGIHLSTPEEKHMVVGGGNRKMLLYSAHDSTLSRIMNTMGVFHPHNPPYAAAFMLELHWDSDHTDHYVKVRSGQIAQVVNILIFLYNLASRSFTVTRLTVPRTSWRSQAAVHLVFCPTSLYPRNTLSPEIWSESAPWIMMRKLKKNHDQCFEWRLQPLEIRMTTLVEIGRRKLARDRCVWPAIYLRLILGVTELLFILCRHH